MSNSVANKLELSIGRLAGGVRSFLTAFILCEKACFLLNAAKVDVKTEANSLS